MLSLAPNMLPDTWQVPKYFKWMPVMTEFTFSLHLSWVLVPLPLGYQISTSNPVNPNHKLSEFWAPPLAFALLFSSLLLLPSLVPFLFSHVTGSPTGAALSLTTYISRLSDSLHSAFSVFEAHSSAPFFTAALSQASYHFLPCQLQSLLIHLSSLNFNSLKTKYITVFKAL